MKPFYTSSNGDRWYLVYSRELERAFVRHVPNEPSGGKPSNIELAAFLSRPGNPPELQALMRVIGGAAQQEEEAERQPPQGLQGPYSPTD
jgi:hypothetical protein